MTKRVTLLAVSLGLGLVCTGPAEARSFRVAMLPNAPASCNTCHTAGGGSPRNSFGLAVEALVTPNGQEVFWSSVLAEMDSDGDGFTNGEELGDPDGDGMAEDGFTATEPGSADSFPVSAGDDDTDTTVELPTGEIGPVGLDLDTADGDQMVRQTATNPVAGDQIEIDVFISEGATGSGGFSATLVWDPAEVTFEDYSGAGLFAAGIILTTPGVITAADSTAELQAALFGAFASDDAGSGGRATFTINEGFSGPTTVRLTTASFGSGDLEIGPGAAFVVIGGSSEPEPQTPAEAANFDGDPEVGFTDFLIFAGGFGSQPGDDNFDARLDLDGDGVVGFTDFLLFAAVFGTIL